MSLEAVMHAQTREKLSTLQANRGECPGRVGYVDADTAKKHALRGVSSFLCQKCYRFHHGKPARKASAIEKLFA